MPKILLVEDDPFISDIYKKKFESSGFEVVNVASGRSVLKVLEDQTFDIILLDMVIPELSGIEVLRELRGPKYPAKLLVVVFSNLSNPEEREEVVRLGANGFISKTEFSPSQVVAEVNRYLRQFSEQERNENRRLAGGAQVPDTTEALGTERKRILFIEDEAIFVDMFGKKLMDEGYEVLIERDGQAGFARAQAEPHLDLILTDAMLPGMNGKELILNLREEAKTAHTPIFVVSASVDDDELEEMLAAGAVRTYKKTRIIPSQLADEVRELFEEMKTASALS